MTFCVVRYAGPFREYFFKRKREGLPFRKALLATAHKLVRTMFAMLNNKALYSSKKAQAALGLFFMVLNKAIVD